jgi:Raf kinase inhibitor-like YbhB/YbcL family protein
VPRPLRPLLLALALGATVVAACSASDGRALPPPRPDQTTTTPSAPVVPPAVGEVFELQSDAFTDGAPLPDRLTCTGVDVSPALSWTGTPPEAVELALVVRDRNADGFVHWVVTSIDPFVFGFGEGGLPENAVEGTNGAGTVGWLGPCPPSGSGTHAYEFVLHALPEASGLVPGTPSADAIARIEAIATDQAVLSGTVTAGGTETTTAGSASVNEPSVEP